MGAPISREAGIVERRRYSAEDWTTPEGVWTYDNGPYPDSPDWCKPPVCTPAVQPYESRTVVIEPTGHCSMHFFSSQITHGYDDTWAWAWGLPFSQSTVDAGGRFLSTEVWAASAPLDDPDIPHRDVQCSAVQGTPGGQPLRSRSIEYDKDEADAQAHEESDRNQRLIRERTLYLDDDVGGTPRFADRDLTDFDGHGNFRTETTGGNFPGENVKTMTTSYNPHLGSGPWDEAKPWILGTFDTTSVVQGTRGTHAEYCFDVDGSGYPATPFLERRRSLVNTATAPARALNDVVAIFTRTGGNVTLEEYFGGDTEPTISTAGGSLCDLSGLPNPTYGVARSFSFGALSQESYVSTSFNTYDATIDESTGLPSQTKDTAGLATDSTYDARGRLATLTPAEETPTIYTYTPAANRGLPSFTPAEASVRRDGGPGLRVESQFRYDGFGRVAMERRLNDDESTFAERETTYNARGWKKTASEWSSSAFTAYDDYDAFGRPGTVTAPDFHVTSLDYTGVSRVERTVAIAKAGGEVDVTTAETYDRFGRLHAVEEPVGNATLFEYAYDEADRLATVVAGPTGSPVQTRAFTYDGRGFLAGELHPEMGAVSYSAFDARGHAGAMSDPGRTLVYAYDEAERLRTVTSTTEGLVKDLRYDAAAHNGVGKLHQAIRHNRLDVPQDGTGADVDVVVTETYDYDGVQGRVSSRVTDQTLSDFSYTLSPVYDALGRLQSQTYPDCSDALGLCPEDPLTVHYGYGGGFLTAVGTAADADAFAAITYHPNGLWQQIAHGNATSTFQDNDSNGMRRPSRIHVSGVGEGDPFDTSDYFYDGAGNVKTMGVDTFVYDDLSRLDVANVHGYEQDFTYDDYGNLTSVATTPPGGPPDPPESFPVDPSTNRLTGPGVGYDGSGNVTSLDGVSYVLDPMNLTILRNPAPDASEWAAIYTADDERLAVWDTSKGELEERWTLRSLSNQVLREFRFGPPIIGSLIFEDGFESGDTSAWSLTEPFVETTSSATSPPSRFGDPVWSIAHSYVYRGGALLAESNQGEIRHYHLDHLGSVRQVTSPDADVAQDHDYLPYGAEVPSSSGAALLFTGHERDAHGAGGADDLDYMHARYCMPHHGRFMNVDPETRAASRSPQRWNRYAYVRDNPLTRFDPDGRDDVVLGFETDFGLDNSAEIELGAALGFVPVLGDVLDGGSALLGVDLTSGEKLSTTGRVISGLGAFAPFVGAKALRQFGNLDVLKTKRLKNLGIHGEDLKREFVGKRSAGEFNISVDKETGEVVLVPVRKGKGPAVRTGRTLKELEDEFPIKK